MRKEPRLKFLEDMNETVRRRMALFAPRISKEESYILPGPSLTALRLARTLSNTPERPAPSPAILYTPDKELIRSIADRKLVCAFMNKKRATVLEYLLEVDERYVPTTTLISISKSPSEAALRKLIQGINVAVKTRLKLKEKIVVGKQGFGYRINENLTVIKA